MDAKSNPTNPKGFAMTLNEKLFTAGPVVEHEGRWFVTAGNPGFNSTRNNCGGWSNRKAAERFVKRFSKGPK